ncbi:flagellar hook-associated protein 3 [Pseudoalteromonas sp. MEBiC 03607]|jgi:flagellar hook-associated protein 3 FlgL|uniref:flagellar hook-associated protein FlgL n=1 Tax=unclassified Pseudoalteromonas TaxID=194690 RepID=UPI0010935B87|nr:MULTISPECIES: flagellar hook-associated protein FlgL [unclassified Pseudoalteromonas]MCO7248568.1 flagellar hook-associated protein FlgL [Pseudoalteromonas sp. Ps84H-4]TGV19852.1 flagellar hook-associated protein 3 [Pseudoalteromonas sp. MEBiC 03607]|tara:strand:+ start:822 stop:2054 length:1233 start_codon:yes stop_codon:yes gene_type:complete
MRISNNMMYKNNLNSILNSQQNVNKAQEQVNTQKRVLTAADDPSATARALLYSDRIQGNEQFTKNITMLNSRLTTEESVLQNIKGALESAYTLSIQAGNGAYSDIDREGIAEEVKALQSTVLDLMNAKTEDGKYIFSGYQDNTPTYSYDSASGRYEYGGDQGQHKIKVAEGVEIKSSDNGFDTFEKVNARLNVASNNGTVSGGITSSKIYVTEQGDFDSFHKSNYNADPAAAANANTLSFITTTGTPNTYVVQQAGVTIGSGSFDEGKINFKGMQVTIDPVANGQVDVDLEAPQKENALNTLDDLIAGLTAPNLTQEEFDQVLADAVVQLNNAKNQVSLVQAGLGGRLNTAKKIEESNSDLDINNKAAKAELVELDMAEAITELTKQETALQASQATFGRLANLSLFDYL